MLSGRILRKLASSLKPRGILCVLFGFTFGCVFNITTIRRFTEWRLLDATNIPIGIPMSELSSAPNAVSINLASKPVTPIRILCMILTMPNNHALQARAVKRTWASRCDDYFFHGLHHYPSVLISVGSAPNAVSINLASKPVTPIRILCMILTMPNNHALQARAVKRTWASRCDDYFFVSSENDTQLPAYAAVSTENRNQLWDKTKFGVIYAATQYGRPFDYLFKADDDTYVIMENLRKMLEEHPKNQSIIMGRRFKVSSSFCGSILFVGQCAQAVGVNMVDSLDAEGLERFHPFPAFVMLNLEENNPSNWLTHFNYHKLLVGQRCCSNYSITFHYIKPPEMFTYDFLLYHIHTVFNKAQRDLSEK
ncbi:hypothetical protein EG68_08324 [Paragonimus skrjabini miyazakii]|uniref:N-acetylgalactosaminide beta-1,3-galactosyltransferase n=1 Tax=Paragonimus skrjabini miyazakii TaxID=59628 RepID=A0A8S9YW47_9TREM|nr:hypothetical protein EG68_08324 [Paragonimus skrjabini miyazakii]